MQIAIPNLKPNKNFLMWLANINESFELLDSYRLFSLAMENGSLTRYIGRPDPGNPEPLFEHLFLFWIDSMIRELQELKIELMFSIWLAVDNRFERSIRTLKNFQGETLRYDAINPRARECVWQKVKTNYYDWGIRVFWLDEAEPEFNIYDFDDYRYYIGSNLAIGNIDPVCYAEIFYKGTVTAG